MDYIFEEEDYFRKNTLYNEFEKEISEFLLNDYTEFEIENSSLIIDFIENSEVYPIVDLQSDQLLKNTDIIAMLVFYSNYDCTNSFDTIETSDYLKEIFKVVKKGITKEDFMYEHQNGAYGGSLFIIPFKTSLLEYLDFKEEFKKSEKIVIPENTCFGFYSSFQGSASVFEKTTTKNMTLKIQHGKTEYDHIGLKADLENSYSLNEIFGGFNCNEVNFKLK